jgi:hypothetical protein
MECTWREIYMCRLGSHVTISKFVLLKFIYLSFRKVRENTNNAFATLTSHYLLKKNIHSIQTQQIKLLAISINEINHLQ